MSPILATCVAGREGEAPARQRGLLLALRWAWAVLVAGSGELAPLFEVGAEGFSALGTVGSLDAGEPVVRDLGVVPEPLERELLGREAGVVDAIYQLSLDLRGHHHLLEERVELRVLLGKFIVDQGFDVRWASPRLLRVLEQAHVVPVVHPVRFPARPGYPLAVAQAPVYLAEHTVGARLDEHPAAQIVLVVLDHVQYDLVAVVAGLEAVDGRPPTFLEPVGELCQVLV